MQNIITLLLILISITMDAQINALEFANTARYAKQNETVKTPKAVFLGNSITEGWVNAMPDFFTKNNFIGRGISGQTSAQVLLRFRQDVIDLNPKIVIINIGTNDVAENTGPYDLGFTLSNIESMIQLAQANKIKVIVASVLPAKEFVWRKSLSNVGQKIVDLNFGLQELAKKYKVKYLDYHSVLKDGENGLSKEMAEDGVHPTLKCYEVMAGLAIEKVFK